MLWVVKQRNLWGDFGTVLISGNAHRETPTGPLLLHRTGPFLPPISFPWMRAGGHRIVVSDEFRRQLESSGSADLQFGPAVKSRIIKLTWDKWDLAAEGPEQYPDGEPENYIEDKPHNARAAAAMPKAWEFLPPLVPIRVRELQNPQGGFLDKYGAYSDQVEFPSLFTDHAEYGELIINDATRKWFESRVEEWVTFCDVELTNAEPAE
ncbi:MAG: hypothetical protein K8T89_07805 [Planctomycetes bacterium]|nr:hypothetical protein [Planctomycetota bacterium]